MSAFAGNSGETVYETELPSVESEVVPTYPKKHKPHQAEQTNPQAKGSQVKGEPGATKSESEGRGGGGVGTTGGRGGSGGDHGGNPASGGGGGNISESTEVPPASTPGRLASESSGGGSSPIVPILIAVAVLAAISIGVVVYRQRKGGSGQDGRVSSSNAS